MHGSDWNPSSNEISWRLTGRAPGAPAGVRQGEGGVVGGQGHVQKQLQAGSSSSRERLGLLLLRQSSRAWLNGGGFGRLSTRGKVGLGMEYEGELSGVRMAEGEGLE
jgi:hypothetical protein